MMATPLRWQADEHPGAERRSDEEQRDRAELERHEEAEAEPDHDAAHGESLAGGG